MATPIDCFAHPHQSTTSIESTAQHQRIELVTDRPRKGIAFTLRTFAGNPIPAFENRSNLKQQVALVAFCQSIIDVCASKRLSVF
jgi:hypothetical protein